MCRGGRIAYSNEAAQLSYYVLHKECDYFLLKASYILTRAVYYVWVVRRDASLITPMVMSVVFYGLADASVNSSGCFH